jgi:RNA polymerase sigma factor (TIGR02999 family)
MTPQADPGEITIYLKRLSAGDTSAEAPLAEAVYAQLRRVARSVAGRRGADATVPATALVDEALIELIRIRDIDWKDREHFFRVASRTIRRRLIDHIRAGDASKRPPRNSQVELEDVLIPVSDRIDEILMVSDGLEKLAEFDSALAELIEMVYFGGIGIATLARVRNVSEKTIDRHLELGRRWLGRYFSSRCPEKAAKAASIGRE